jgi:hypothetical protein
VLSKAFHENELKNVININISNLLLAVNISMYKFCIRMIFSPLNAFHIHCKCYVSTLEFQREEVNTKAFLMEYFISVPLMSFIQHLSEFEKDFGRNAFA